MVKFFLLLASAVFATVAFAQKYTVSVETQVAGKVDDRFSFSIAEGETQVKGFEGKLLAKRYNANGFPHRIIKEKKEIKEADAKDSSIAKRRPADIVREMLDKAQAEYSASERRIDAMQGQREGLAEKVKELEDLLQKAERGSSSFAPAYAEFKKKNELTDEDVKYRKLMRKRPKNTGDVEEIDYGTYCNITINKVVDKAVSVDLNYTYSHIVGSLYAEGTNNSNTITKQYLPERIDKLGVKNLKLILDKPYCFQFGRQKPEKSRTLAEAVAATGGIFGGGESSPVQEVSPVSEAKSEFDAEGLYSEIKRKFATDKGKVIRVIITIRKEQSE